MAFIKSKEKKERSLGIKLFLKAERCNSPKCAMVRKPYKPGPHGKTSRRSASEFGHQLLEKQKIMFSYGLREAQMRKIFDEAFRKKQAISETIINLLERRLDNVVFRSGLAPSRIMARQFINHGHILVNGRKVTIPSFRVKINDVISVKESSKNSLIFKKILDNIKKQEAPAWISVDKEKMEAGVKSAPQNVEVSFDVNLVVDYYAR